MVAAVAALLLLPSIGAAASPRAAPAAVPTDPVLYTTRAGDNLYTLARRYFTRIEDYVRVQRLNHVSDPYRLPVGRVLRIPRALLRFEPLTATVIAHRGPVAIRSGGQVRAVKAGSTVREGDQIVTANNAFVSLRLPDSSVVSLPSQSQVGVRRLRRILLTGGIERLFALERGRARAIVTPAANDDDSFRVSTPVAVSAVRGTEFRARYDEEAARAATEVLEGRVSVAVEGAEQKALTVAAGFGTVATASGTADAIALLPSPALQRPGRVQDESELAFEVTPLRDAAAYRVQVASDAGFLDVISEATTPGESITLPSIPDGTWFVRTTAIGDAGIEGLPATYGFERRLQRIETALERRRAGRYREYLFRWIVEGSGTRRYRFQLMKDRPDAAPMVDEVGLVADRFVITDLPPGTYYWRVMSIQFADGGAFSKWSPIERLTISRDE
ncbi:peptidoglycan-binding protein LysM [Novosphingobium endophyticum]|uniref:Peptidoglycan-binding protein LysM n=2 Tax=Novosphingobium endophyticum TaxID=1955250 RepID=A0A916TQ23_9SPHN|nr:peptidoglycan-binding protein LysM [Novosphingobium endophyticum]